MWNSLDADADKISVRFEQNALGALERIRVTDNGNGIPYGEAELLFGSLGGSWKSKKNRTARKVDRSAGRYASRWFANMSIMLIFCRSDPIWLLASVHARA